MLSSLTLYGTAFILAALLAVIAIVHFRIDLTKCVVWTVVAVFFPINFQFLGRDAITTGGVVILITYVLFLAEAFRNRTPMLRNNDWMVYLLIVFGLVGSVLAIENGLVAVEDIGPAVRQYVAFAAALLLFMVVKNVVQDRAVRDPAEAAALVERLLSLIIMLTAAHVIISMVNKYFPFTNEWVAVFYPKEAEALSPEGQNRIRSFVFGYEYFGEMLAALSPLAIYKAASTRKPWWFACLAVFSCGVFLTVTRSGILLFMLGVGLSLFFQFRGSLFAGVVLTAALALVLAGFVVAFPQAVSDVAERFSTAETVYVSGGSLFDTINRGNFPELWDYVMSELNLYGHSLVRIDFHNLFLTTLHQLGVLGAALFFLALLYPPVLLARSFFTGSGRDNRLVFACLLFVSLFLVNETKVEFTRFASYSQICWLLMALCFLVARLPVREPARPGREQDATAEDTVFEPLRAERFSGRAR